MERTAVVTGASSGIGAATARRLAAAGFKVVAGARRVERLEELAAECGAIPVRLDVTDAASVEALAAHVDRCDVLVNNAGLASGLEPVGSLTEQRVRTMWETNVLGLLRVTQALLPAIERAEGHIVNIGSTAAHETYPGGGGYTASKHAMRALTKTMRLDLLGRPIRVTEVDPGMVETEFSIVRFDGDGQRAKQVYENMTPLTADDVADCIAWAVTRPSHVNIDEIVVRPRDQATSRDVFRR